MKKKLLSIAAACVLGVQAIAMPMIANAEQGTHYVEKSDFNDRNAHADDLLDPFSVPFQKFRICKVKAGT